MIARDNGEAMNSEDLRDYFAAHAPDIPDWYRSSKVHCVSPTEKMALMVSWRWAYADAMIAGRGK